MKLLSCSEGARCIDVYAVDMTLRVFFKESYVCYVCYVCMHAWTDGRTDGWLFDVVCMSGYIQYISYNFRATFKHSGQSLTKLFFIDGTEC